MPPDDGCVHEIESLLERRCFETARRKCLQAISLNQGDSPRLKMLLHSALVFLGEIGAAQVLVHQMLATSDANATELTILLAEDYHLLTQNGSYRSSTEAKEGLTEEEFNERMRKRSAQYFEKAAQLAQTESLKRTLDAALMRCGRIVNPTPEVIVDGTATGQMPQSASLRGLLRFVDGQPVGQATVTLGLAFNFEAPDPTTYLEPDIGYAFKGEEQKVLVTHTDLLGRFIFEEVPIGRHEFLAVTLDPQQFNIPTRFFAQGIEIGSEAENYVEATIDEWESAPPDAREHAFEKTLNRLGVEYRLISSLTLKNPFYYEFPRQLISFKGQAASGFPQRLLVNSSNEAQVFQQDGDRVMFFAQLAARGSEGYALYRAENPGGAIPAEDDFTPNVEGDSTAVIDTGRAKFRIPWGNQNIELPPLISIQGEDGKWRGKGRWVLPEGCRILNREITIQKTGPLFLEIHLQYDLSNGGKYTIRLGAQRGEATLSAH